jgi:hypothetical protein
MITKSKDLHLSRNTVRRAMRSGETIFQYERRLQPMPNLRSFIEMLTGHLEQDETQVFINIFYSGVGQFFLDADSGSIFDAY